MIQEGCDIGNRSIKCFMEIRPIKSKARLYGVGRYAGIHLCDTVFPDTVRHIINLN